ncbi:hypothetical protein E8M24_32970 [Bacillus thuringiensis]|uniref:DUF3139 domain-containing protein n=1 Tax=Bacillus thuringiensis TaxID=1428 RepID=UPI00125FC1A5|nr:DUF3139 domain-containing protein [Bacillus thuringiensis]KAB5621744.1 hypothetical protein E8M24_32970 [Bacillus thuringiensis]HDR5272242.1 DUF3139 domain-containing protein [Bacillus thuringiensis]
MKKVLLVFIFVLLISVAIGFGVYQYKKHVAQTLFDNYISGHGITKGEVQDTHFGLDLLKSGSFVKQFKLKGDNPKYTYILSTTGKQNKVEYRVVSSTGENVHRELKSRVDDND